MPKQVRVAAGWPRVMRRPAVQPNLCDTFDLHRDVVTDEGRFPNTCAAARGEFTLKGEIQHN
jgi:hypothetical protein